MSTQKLSFKEKLGYGFGDAGCNLLWKIIGMYLMIFYTDVFGIPAAVAGTMFIVTRIGDAFFDPVVGIIADRTQTRWGKFRPFLLWIAIPFGVAGVFLFTTPSFGMTGRIVYAYVSFSLMMIIYSLINVPYASLMGVMTSDSQERTTLATFRFVFAYAGSFLVLGMFQPLFDGIGTKTYSEFNEPKMMQISDSTAVASGEKAFVWDGKLIAADAEGKTDSLLFLTANVITKSKDAFKIGLINTKTNESDWLTFPAGKDTLKLVRKGITSKISIKMSSFVSKENMADLANLKFVYSTRSDQEVSFNKVSIKRIDYKHGYQRAVMVVAVLAVMFFLVTFLLTRERVKPIVQKISLKSDLKDLVRNKPWFILLGASISSLIFNNLRDGATVYYFLYYFKGQSSFEVTTTMVLAISTVYLLVGQASNIIGVLLAKPVSNKIGKKNTFMIAMLNASVLSVCFFWVDPTNLVSIFILHSLISINAGMVFPLVWSMFADTADYSEWKNGRRATGLVFSAATMSQKIGGTIGIGAVALLLSFYGYQPNVEQSITAQNGIRMMLSIFPAIGALSAAFFMFIFPLKATLMKKIETELADRRALVK
jgi:GPH family glycoside/pentoside/hexuronide:cation symporter